MTSDRWLIVGAGPSGLATARAFKERGVPYDLVERHSDVGGIWDLENPDTPMYETAHFISSKTCSAFDDHPMPESYPDYPSQGLILDYIRSFADRFDLRSNAQFDTTVQSAVPSPDGGWNVALGGEQRHYRGIIAAVGHNWDPCIPAYPGNFTGEAYHSAHYRSPSEFHGKRVLIVGGGNSACDIACDAAVHAREAMISLRRGYHFLPKHVFGRPLDAFFRSGPQLPARIAQPLLTLLLRLLVGDLRRFGLPKPDHRVLESHPILNTQILHYLAHGDLVATSDIVRLDGHTVHFNDGSRAELDLIIWATGFRPTIPFLASTLPASNGASIPLFAQVFPAGVKDLFVVGHFETDGGAYPVVSRQAALLALLAEQHARNPATVHSWIENLTSRPPPNLGGGIRYINSLRHSYYVQFEAYDKYLHALTHRARKELRS
jgi:cation diffusion facilitator CzcD-associated flavoprotein CzcO